MPVTDDERTQSRLGRYDEQAGVYREAALKFSQLAVTNLILINAGGLLALANGIFNAHIQSADTATRAAVWFVCGLMSGVICSYVAYLNFGGLASQQQALRTADDWRDGKRRMTAIAISAQIPFDQKGFLTDGRSLSQYAEECDRVILDQTNLANRLPFWINSTFAAGQIFGIVSMICFAAACLVMVAAGFGSRS